MLEKLNKDMIDAMKNKETVKLTVIREIKGNMKLAEIDQKKEMNDDLLIEVVSKGIKTRKESIKEFEKGNRQDLIDKSVIEIEILEKYLPEQLSSEEVIKIIDEIFVSVNPTSIKDMGKIMSCATEKLKGRTDISEVSKIIREKLNNL